MIIIYNNEPKIIDYDNCNVYSLNKLDNEIIIVRRSKHMYSRYRKQMVKINYMLDFTVSSIQEPRIEVYKDPYTNELRERIVSQLDSNYWIWEWVNDNIKSIEESKVYEIYKCIREKHKRFNRVFPIEVKDNEEIIPVIYQPAIDTYNNFLREIHCHKINNNELEVTLIFNNEELRKHALANKIYEWFRRWFYGRKIDIESFKILLEDNKPRYLQFPGIYSGKNGIEQDNIHEDNPDYKGDVPKRDILYYFANYNHPIIFVNTSNHAMAEYDNNTKLWKWEYLAWEEDTPIIYGDKSRREIEKSFKPFWRILIEVFNNY